MGGTNPLHLLHGNARLLRSSEQGQTFPISETQEGPKIPTKTQQLSDAWLGGGEKSGLAKILAETSAFLKAQKKISEVLPSYSAFVTTDALAALKKNGV